MLHPRWPTQTLLCGFFSMCFFCVCCKLPTRTIIQGIPADVTFWLEIPREGKVLFYNNTIGERHNSFISGSAMDTIITHGWNSVSRVLGITSGSTILLKLKMKNGVLRIRVKVIAFWKKEKKKLYHEFFVQHCRFEMRDYISPGIELYMRTSRGFYEWVHQDSYSNPFFIHPCPMCAFNMRFVGFFFLVHSQFPFYIFSR